MIKKIKSIFVVGLMVLGIGVLFAPLDVSAVNVIGDQCANTPDAAICKDAGSSPADLISTIVNILLFLIGTISVIMLIIGGLMYATSAGDTGQVTKAKNTIMYAVVGLLIAFFAYAIVNFVVMRFV